MADPTEQEFVAEHEPLVRKLAARVRAQLDLTTSLEDLVAYGFGGLIEARARFDPSRGVQFRSFAHYRIRGAIIDGVRHMAYLPRTIHANRRAAETLDRVAEAVGDARAANPDERSEMMATLEAIDDILGKTSAAFVISALGQSPADGPPGPEEEAVSSEARARITAVLDLLPARERALIDAYYFEDRTLEEIGEAMGISKSWASRLHAKALALLRDALE